MADEEEGHEPVSIQRMPDAAVGKGDVGEEKE